VTKKKKLLSLTPAGLNDHNDNYDYALTFSSLYFTCLLMV
jgi:hypothetical protein